MIPFTDFTREYKAIKKEINGAINRVLNRGWFVLGPEVENFEKKFARYVGVKYCVGVNSGTDALYLSLLCAGIRKDDEVIIPVNTALPTAMAVIMSGAKPVFIDCDELFLLDIKSIPRLINKKTKAIMPVHLYGQTCDMEKLKKTARTNNLILIEDCAQAGGAGWRGKKVGSFGDFGCFSFYPTKNLGAYGDGGAITTNNKIYYEKLLAMRFYGQADRAKCLMFGVNSRLDEIQAAILSVKLKHLDVWNKKRQEMAMFYRKSITNQDIILPPQKNRQEHIYHLFVVRVKNREAIIKILKDNGIQTLIHYPMILSQHPFLKKYANGLFPRAKTYESEILSLPMHPFLKKQEIKKIAEVLNKIK